MTSISEEREPPPRAPDAGGPDIAGGDAGRIVVKAPPDPVSPGSENTATDAGNMSDAGESDAGESDAGESEAPDMESMDSGSDQPPPADPCQDNPCDDRGDSSATCAALDGGFACTCGAGFMAEKGVCDNVDECTAQDNPCDDGDDPAANCVDTDGAYRCECSAATFEGSSGKCVARAEVVLPSCRAILEAGRSTGDGTYRIDPFGDGPFEVTCDMTTDGGGWTGVTAALARSGFRATMTTLATGTCDLRGDNPRARSRVGTLVCRYDMELGFMFSELWMVGGSVAVRSAAGDPAELHYNGESWGNADCIAGDEGTGAAGDVRFGAASSAAGALSLGAQSGLDSCGQVRQINSGNELPLSGRSAVAEGSVLRLELTESGGIEAEGWEWTGGTVFVR